MSIVLRKTWENDINGKFFQWNEFVLKKLNLAGCWRIAHSGFRLSNRRETSDNLPPFQLFSFVNNFQNYVNSKMQGITFENLQFADKAVRTFVYLPYF